MQRIYLDYAATTPVREEVLETMLPYCHTKFGNPSSIHSFGQETRTAVENARDQVASLIGARPEEIVFTSGGTEADNLAIKGIFYALKDRGNHIIISSIEHHAVLETCKFVETLGGRVTRLSVDGHGLVNPDDLRAAITEGTILISIMHASNEIGTIEPIADLSAVARERGIAFHTDAVQATGHIPTNVDELGVDMLAMSAHKLHGPKGVGALYVRKGTRLVPFMHGGEQEHGRRASTENVPGIVGFGKAAELASAELADESDRLTGLRTKLIESLFARIDNITLNGHPTLRLPNNVNVSIDFVEGESIIINLDLAGIAASTGSACSSADAEPSHTLLALGVPREKAHGSVRFTMGRETTEAEVDRVIAELPPIVERLRSMSPLLK